MSEPKFHLCACVHCANHIEFPGEMVGMVVDCPHCAKSTLLTVPNPDALPIAAPVVAAEKPPEKKAAKSRIGAILGVIALLAFIAGGVFLLTQIKPRDDRATSAPATPAKGEPPAPPRIPDEPPPPRKPGDDLQILRLAIEKAEEGNLRYVAGVITNHADKQLFNVKVEFEMLNSNGQAVGNATDYLGNLGAHTAWDFRAHIVDRDGLKARLIKLVGEKD